MEASNSQDTKGGCSKFFRSSESSSSTDSVDTEVSDLLGGVENKLKSFAEEAGLLLIAAARGSTFMIKCLLHLGLDPDVLDKDGLKPVQVAAARGKLEAVEVLLPKTSQIPDVKDWSVDGILQEMKSKCGITKKSKSNELHSSSDANSSSNNNSNLDLETDDILKGMPKWELNKWDFDLDTEKMPLQVNLKTNKKVEAEKASSHIQVIQHPRFSDDFEELAEISSGGFGQVFKCLHKLDKRIKAIKKVAFSLSHPENTYCEVTAHASMQCSHIVQYHQSWVEQGCFAGCKTLENGDTADHTLFIQMELCGRLLKQMLEDNAKMSKSFERQHILLFTKQILMALEHVHSSGYIHGDISRSNIFFNKDENMIKIGDFGLARELIDGEAVVDFDEWGAIMYEPTQPEVGRNIKNVKSDMFSTGLVLYDIWYQFKTNQERQQVFNKIRLGILPPTMHQFHRYLLAYNPLERPTVEEALADFNTHFGPELVMNVGL